VKEILLEQSVIVLQRFLHLTDPYQLERWARLIKLILVNVCELPDAEVMSKYDSGAYFSAFETIDRWRQAQILLPIGRLEIN